MKNKQKGFVGIIVIILIAIVAIGIIYFYSTQKTKANNTISNSNTPTPSPVASNSNDIGLTDAQFIAATEDPEGKVRARGDINADGFEDAIVQEIHCGASCSISLQVVLNEQNKRAVLVKDKNYPDTFAPAYVASSAIKSEVTNIAIDSKGIISLTGNGLACTEPNSEEACTEEKWRVVKTIKYKFDGKDIVQIN